MSPAARRRSRDLKRLRHFIKQQSNVLARRSKLILSRENAEDVHQMRVATRRLRAALAAVNADKSRMAHDVRWLTRKLGAVRDLDVQMAQLGKPAAQQRYHAYLYSQWTPARRQLIRALQSRRMQRLLNELGALPGFMGKNAGLDLHACIYGELKHIKRTGGRIRNDSPFERLHRLRIHCKRLRYQIEILQPSSESSLGATLTELKKLLERLGALQDSRVTIAHLLEYEETLDAEHTDHKSLDRMLAKQERRAEQIRQTFPAAWRRFDKKLDHSLADLERSL